MIATTRRMAIQDFLLIAFSVVVIVLSLWPQGDARQTLVFRHHSGALQQYSFEADDPRLEKLRHELANRSRRVPDASLTRETWRAEVADFYASSTDRSGKSPDQVVRVSFSDVPPSQAVVAELKQLSDQHQYWINVRNRARKAIAAAESRLKQQQMQVGPPPIEFGKVSHGGHPPNAFALASLIALSVAAGFAWWSYLWPAIRLRADSLAPQLQTPKPEDAGKLHELRLVIPAKWVRIHQPAPVLIRRIAYTTVVVGAVACAVF